MRIRFNPFLLGIFIIGGLALAIAILLGLGSALFHKAGHFVFYLPNSAGGLDVGSGVRMDGVRVGQIDQITVYYSPRSGKSFVGITCEIDKDILNDPRGGPIQLTEANSLKALIAKGLVVQVQTAGLVGNEYVELWFNRSQKPIELAGLPATEELVVPTIPSTMSALRGNVSEILSNLQKIDYQGLMQQVRAVLLAANGQINELQTNHLTDHISTAAQNIGAFMNSGDLRAAVLRLQGAASTFQNLMTNLNARVAPASTNLNATMAAARESLGNLQDFLKLRNQLGEQTYELMNQLNETARSIEQLSDFLQQHPNALITGRAKQKDVP
ncbi:MAG: MlaD family protein [Limisphaerales bacterium]